MPIWGFTREMRETRPFGLPEDQLKPGKIIADPVHRDVGLTKLEIAIVDTPIFQRLRRVRQLGTTHLVYPGASHSRFSHALGAVRAVQVLLDYADEQRDGLHPVPDLLGQWRDTDPQYYREQLARATVLARLSALLHDICHIPFGHSIEDEMGILKRHDKNARRLDSVWRGLSPEVQHLLSNEGLDEAIKDIISPKLKIKSEIAEQYKFVGDLVGNTICADLADYLARDHLFTGLPIALGHRFLSALFITPDTEAEFFRRRMVLSITRDGHERADVVTELVKYLRYRYELGERVLSHHAKIRADAMVGKALLLWRDEEADRRRAADANLSDTDARREASAWLEDKLLEFGDDGLLERLINLNEGAPGDPKGRQKAIRKLARDLLNRELFPLAGRASARGAPAETLWKKYKKPRERQRVEHDVAQYAEVEPWKVAIWLPSADMGLKVARVLVYDGKSVEHFNDHESKGRKRGMDLYDLHRDLWAISAFVDESVTLEQRQEILVRLAQRFDIHWETGCLHDRVELDLGDDTQVWPDRLAAERVADEFREEARKVGEELKPARILAHAVTVQARQPGQATPTFRALRHSYAEVARSLVDQAREPAAPPPDYPGPGSP